ncbi:MAG TPA: hypothetical protein VKK81_05455, partial [Candidatus Binatia bacterium]|nr:hypothetical protein [Candidatus Binatia bacterium]
KCSDPISCTVGEIRWDRQRRRQANRDGRIEIQKLCVTAQVWRDRSLRCSTTNIRPPADVINEEVMNGDLFPTHCPFTTEQMLDVEFWPA